MTLILFQNSLKEEKCNNMVDISTSSSKKVKLLVENFEDITNFCRLCLTNNTIIRNIFSNDHNNWVENDISSQIFDCTNIQVVPNDGPTGICSECLKEIISIITFKNQCIRVNNYLRRHYQQFPNKCLEILPLKDDYTSFIELGDEHWLLGSNTDNDDVDNGNKNIESNDDLTSPRHESVEESDFSYPPDEDDYDDDNNCDSATHHEKKKFKKKRKAADVNCIYKLTGPKKSGNFDEPWPKLKKRDLMETKAYRGLCHLCGKEFQHLWVHLKSHNTIPTDTCDICGKGFRSKVNLGLHILMHAEAQLPCEICGKLYRTKMRLKRHMRVHTGERPYLCNICEKRFYTKYNLDVHMRSHTGEKPFICKFCNERFTHSYAIKQHLKKYHDKSADFN